jgi:aryl-alcohol dehydrogenase-like predicted oxidoreductase
LTGKYNEGIPEGSRLGLAGYEWLKDLALREERIDKVRKLNALAKELGVSLASLSIAWCIHNPFVTTAILGATRREQLLENLKALELREGLDTELLGRIEAIVQNKPRLPEF